MASTAAAGILWMLNREDPGDPRLRSYVHARPPIPVVFTSRTEPASLVAAAPEGEIYTYPGQRLWQAREGRLRLLTPGGMVHELTWGKLLPDGSTLIDVMSPTVSLDGTRIIFAGRKGGDDPGHFRIYEIGVDGTGLRQVTGGPDDEGCRAVPPMRYERANGPVLDPQTRRRIDYDDVDPCHYPDGSIVFASTRTPDLGRGHARRATNLWMLAADGAKFPVTSNRNNDRWPFVTNSAFLAFSLWSRNTEVITADEKEIKPYEPGMPTATQPTNSWLGGALQPTTIFFGAIVKTPIPVWRPRPLGNGRIAFMTDLSYAPGAYAGETPGILQVVQADAGLIEYVPSARRPDSPLPRHDGPHVYRGPSHDAAGRTLSVATPSPCPDDQVLLAAAPVEPGQAAPSPGSYGLYLASQDWLPGTDKSVPAGAVGLQLLFDDPEFVDAEPVAVYARLMGRPSTDTANQPPPPSGGGPPRGPSEPGASPMLQHSGVVSIGPLYTTFFPNVPGKRTDCGEEPIYEGAPVGTLAELRFYESQRDRFDDPKQERVKGGWKLMQTVDLHGDQSAQFDLSANEPKVVAGFTKEGRVAKWTTRAADSQGRHATFYAFAGDHYSGVRTGVFQFCAGCHPGHSGPGLPAATYAEHRR